MATTKTVTVLADDVTLTASAVDTESSVWTLDDGYGGELSIKVTNGATGPTIAAQAQIWVSPDSTNWYKFGGSLVSTLGNSVVSSWGGIIIPVGTKYLKVVAGSNTGQDVTLRVEGTEVVAIS